MATAVRSVVLLFVARGSQYLRISIRYCILNSLACGLVERMKSPLARGLKAYPHMKQVISLFKLKVKIILAFAWSSWLWYPICQHKYKTLVALFVLDSVPLRGTETEVFLFSMLTSSSSQHFIITPPPAAGINDGAASLVVFVLAIYYGFGMYRCKYDKGGSFGMVKRWDGTVL